MNQLKNVSNQELLESLHGLIKNERKLQAQVLEHLTEIYRRRVHLARGYSSLFTFCVKELGYTESQAQRRVLAMRATQEMPELEKKLELGKVSLATLSLAQSHLMAKEKAQGCEVTREARTELFAAIEDKSKREVETYLAIQVDLDPRLSRFISQKKNRYGLLVASTVRHIMNFAFRFLRDCSIN